MSENQNIEWKTSWRDEYLKWICAFANADGGILYIGVNDKGQVVGLDNHQKLLEDLPNKIRDILGIIVKVNLHSDDNKYFIEIKIDACSTPISYHGNFYYRSGSTIQNLKGPALEKLLLKKMGKKWDGVAAPGFTLDDLSSEAMQLFRKKARKSKRIPEEDLNDSNEILLKSLGLFYDNQLKRAAVIAFGKNPEQLITGAYVKIGFFRTHTDLLYQDEIHGSLFTQVEKTMDLLLTKYMKANIGYEGLTRTETYDYPEKALREALLNALIHKDYSSANPVQISVYSDWLMIYNNGELPKNWTVETLKQKHTSEPANPDIAHAFFRAGYIEIWGRGTINIVEDCKKAGLPEPKFTNEWGGLAIIFYAEKTRDSSGKIRDKFSEKIFDKKTKNTVKDTIRDTVKDTVKFLSKNEHKIYEIFKHNPKITSVELSEIIGINLRNTKKNIEKLKEKGLIKRIGPAKGGYWKIMEDK
jgi:ATP-dependent DNA helicase RecG